VLTWTAAQLMFHEPRLESFIKGHSLIQAIIYAGIIGGVLLAGVIAERRRKLALGTPRTDRPRAAYNR
jgi:hypothetical protein